MAIRCKLSTLMGISRYNIQDIYQKTGLSRNTISNLYHDKMQRIDYKTLNKLCVVFKCQVGDLLEYYEKD